jgi:hypothetical protein
MLAPFYKDIFQDMPEYYKPGINQGKSLPGTRKSIFEKRAAKFG